ncbi:MAG: type II toxin-antitoxin system RelE/ParE family toxin [Sphingobacteriia bacterium]|nr:type II toxin-antitoxin system RelE/ParE family toxin [Sphingobacteriia bacterium]
MAWKIEFDYRALKELKKFSKNDQREIIDYLNNKVSPLEDATSLGKPLVGNKAGLWRYRVGKIRIISLIQGKTFTILVIRIAKRDKVYDD